MRTAIAILLTVFSLHCVAKTSGGTPYSPTGSSKNAQNIQAIVQFLEDHRGDLPDINAPANSALLGGKEDEFTYRLRNSMDDVSHENLKKYHDGKGWYYLVTIKGFKSGQTAQARECAREFVNTFNNDLTANGFSEVSPNPWPTITMRKPIDEHLETRIWVSYSEDVDGIWVTMQIAVNGH